MQDVVLEVAFSNRAITTNNLSIALKLMIVEVAFNALALEDVATEAVKAVQAVGAALQLTFIEESFLLLIIVDNLYATDLARLIEFGAMLKLHNLFDPADAEVLIELEGALFQ